MMTSIDKKMVYDDSDSAKTRLGVWLVKQMRSRAKEVEWKSGPQEKSRSILIARVIIIVIYSKLCMVINLW